MASGHVNRTNRPSTWLHRPATRREDFPRQPGAELRAWSANAGHTIVHEYIDRESAAPLRPAPLRLRLSENVLSWPGAWMRRRCWPSSRKASTGEMLANSGAPWHPSSRGGGPFRARLDAMLG
jgi:hypothetical protein